MENSIKVICNTSTYLDKSHSNINFSNNASLLVGSISNKSLGNNSYISILNFHMPELHPDSIKRVYLFLFIEDIKPDYKNSYSLGILGNSKNIDMSTIDWSNLPQKNYTKLLNHIINGYNVGYYLKVNVTSLIKSLETHNESYNIFLIPQKQNSNSIIKLSSFDSKYPPYLDIVTYDTDPTSNIDLSEELNIETYIEESEENTYNNESNNSEDTVISQISPNTENDNLKNQEDVILPDHLLNKIMEILINQDFKLNFYNKSLDQQINSLSNKLTNIDNKIPSLDEGLTCLKQNDIETLNTNISSLNNELLELKNILPYLSGNLENLKNIINNFTKTEKFDLSNLNTVSSQLLELSSNLNSLMKVLGSITIEPIN